MRNLEQNVRNRDRKMRRALIKIKKEKKRSTNCETIVIGSKRTSKTTQQNIEVENKQEEKSGEKTGGAVKTVETIVIIYNEIISIDF